MPFFGPIKRNDLIRAFKKAGFEGPFSGGKYQFMRKGSLKVTIPNPHSGDISMRLVNELLKEAGISKSDWEKL